MCGCPFCVNEAGSESAPQYPTVSGVLIPFHCKTLIAACVLCLVCDAAEVAATYMDTRLLFAALTSKIVCERSHRSQSLQEACLRSSARNRIIRCSQAGSARLLHRLCNSASIWHLAKYWQRHKRPRDSEQPFQCSHLDLDTFSREPVVASRHSSPRSCANDVRLCFVCPVCPGPWCTCVSEER